MKSKGNVHSWGKNLRTKKQHYRFNRNVRNSKRKFYMPENQIAGGKNYRQTAQETKIREKTVDTKDQKMSQHKIIMSNQKFFTNERETYCEIQCKKNLPVMKEEVDVQIFHVYHILRKFDRRKITSRHVQTFKF